MWIVNNYKIYIHKYYYLYSFVIDLKLTSKEFKFIIILKHYYKVYNFNTGTWNNFKKHTI
jgi:hypothetical protein